MFKKIDARLGNMRKAVEWVLYPQKDDNEVIIQCDKRICQVDLVNGKGLLSTGKYGNGFIALSFAEKIDIGSDVLNKLRELVAKDPQKGTVIL